MLQQALPCHQHHHFLITFIIPSSRTHSRDHLTPHHSLNHVVPTKGTLKAKTPPSRKIPRQDQAPTQARHTPARMRESPRGPLVPTCIPEAWARQHILDGPAPQMEKLRRGGA